MLLLRIHFSTALNPGPLNLPVGLWLLQVAWIYTVFIAVVFGGLAGLTQAILGSPGDLPDTIKCIHEQGSIPIRQAPSMFICSAFSITAGASHL